jgi:hypothetical protein
LDESIVDIGDVDAVKFRLGREEFEMHLHHKLGYEIKVDVLALLEMLEHEETKDIITSFVKGIYHNAEKKVKSILI